MNPMHQINGRQLTYIITGGQVGSAMLALPAFLSKTAGQHAWLCILLGALVPLINLLVIEKLGSRHTGQNVVKMFQALLGRVIGSIALIGFAIYLVAYAAVLINAFARLVQVYMLPKTPFGVTVFLAMVCITYAISKGGRVVGRINETLFFGLVLSVIFIILPTYYSNDLTNLLPIGQVDAGGLLQGTFETMYVFAGIEILLVLYSQVEKPEEVRPAALKGLVLTVVTYLITTICCLLVFGPYRLPRYVWPGVTILKVASVPVVERFEFYFLALWVGIVLRRAINPAFAASLSLAQLFNIEDRTMPVVLVIGVVIYTLSLLPNSVIMSLYLVHIVALTYLLIGFAFPLVLLVISWLRKGSANANAKA